MLGTVRLLLELSMECEPLARSEAISTASVLGTRVEVELEEPGLVVLETDADPSALGQRLALCHCISEHLFSCPPAQLQESMREVDVPGPIRVHSTRIQGSFNGLDLARTNSELGALLGEGRGVDMHEPASEVRVVLSGQANVGRCLAEVDRSSFEARKVQNLPFRYPITIHPKYARALVNLARVPPGGRLLDPFCGTGSIVAEAALAGLEAIGSDVSEKMVEGAGTNLEFLGVKADLVACDVGAVGEAIGRVDGVATDPPYGRATSTGGEPVPDLMRRTLGACREVLDTGSLLAVAVHDPELLRAPDGFEMVEKHPMTVHRSLTRHFCVLRRE